MTDLEQIRIAKQRVDSTFDAWVAAADGDDRELEERAEAAYVDAINRSRETTKRVISERRERRNRDDDRAR